jgi:hypothetical protein
MGSSYLIKTSRRRCHIEYVSSIACIFFYVVCRPVNARNNYLDYTYYSVLWFKSLLEDVGALLLIRRLSFSSTRPPPPDPLRNLLVGEMNLLHSALTCE